MKIKVTGLMLLIAECHWKFFLYCSIDTIL